MGGWEAPVAYCHPELKEHYEFLRSEYGVPDNTVVTVSGPTGAGTTTIAEYIGDTYGFDHVNSGQFIRDWVQEHGYDLDTFESNPDGVISEIGENPDVAVDQRALTCGFTQDEVVLEGRLTGALLQDLADARFLVDCSVETAAERITDREEDIDTFEGAVTYIEQRREEIPQRYDELYGLDPWDESFYNVFIDNNQSLEAVEDDVDGALARFDLE